MKTNIISLASMIRNFPGNKAEEIAVGNTTPWALGAIAQSVVDNGMPGIGSALPSGPGGIDFISGYGFAPLRSIDFLMAVYDLFSNIKGIYSAKNDLSLARNPYDVAIAKIKIRQANSNFVHGLLNNEIRDIITDPGNLFRTIALPLVHVGSTVSGGVLAGLTGFGGLTYVVTGLWNHAKANRSIRRSTMTYDRMLNTSTLDYYVNQKIQFNKKDILHLGAAISFKGEFSRQLKTIKEERDLIRKIVKITYLMHGVEAAENLASEYKSGKRKPGDVSHTNIGIESVQQAILSAQARHMHEERKRKAFSALHTGFGAVSIGLTVPLALAFPPAGIALGVAAGGFILSAYTLRFTLAALAKRKAKKKEAAEKEEADRLLDSGADPSTRSIAKQIEICEVAKSNEVLAARILSSDLSKGLPPAIHTLSAAGLGAKEIDALSRFPAKEREEKIKALFFSGNGEQFRRSVYGHRGIRGVMSDHRNRMLSSISNMGRSKGYAKDQPVSASESFAERGIESKKMAFSLPSVPPFNYPPRDYSQSYGRTVRGRTL